MYVLVLVFLVSGTPAELIIKHKTVAQCQQSKALIRSRLIDLAPYIGQYSVRKDCEKV